MVERRFANYEMDEFKLYKISVFLEINVTALQRSKPGQTMTFFATVGNTNAINNLCPPTLPQEYMIPNLNRTDHVVLKKFKMFY